MVSVKINNEVFTNVERIHWGLNLIYIWPTQKVHNQIEGFYYLKPFKYMPAPPTKKRKDRVYGATGKIKNQMQYYKLDRTETVELGGYTFRLWNIDEQIAFDNLFRELKGIDSLK